MVSEYPLRKMEVDYDLDEVRERFLKLYTGLIYDVMYLEFGMEGRAMESGIYPLIHTMKVAGPAFTVQCIATPSRDEKIHDMRVAMLRSMSEGCIQIRGTQREKYSGQFGEISATAAKASGCVGAVIDGSSRDTNYLIDMGFPTFCRFRNPVEAFGRFMAVDYQIPIFIRGIDGNLVVTPGDYLFGDNDGVVVVPKDLTVDVLSAAEEYYERERKSRVSINSGKDVWEVYKEFGRF